MGSNVGRPGGIPPEKRWYRRSVRAMITDPWLTVSRVPPDWLTRQTPRIQQQAAMTGLHPDSLVPMGIRTHRYQVLQNEYSHLYR